jgi:hypothetical protein
MLRFTRPRKPDDFDTDVSKARAAVEKAVTAGTGPVEFKPLWRDYKTEFVKAQHGKCGYCESHVLSVYVGDVEHYRPKGALEELPADRAKWGRERQDAGTVEGRVLDPVCERGYWWLAYEWENYLLSCQICNEYWKKCLFPVLEHPRCSPPRKGVWETPLLLTPFGTEDPMLHLHVDEIGQIEAWKESAHGRATIDTCGLDRENLRSHRAHFAKMAYPLVRNLQTAIRDDALERVFEHVDSLHHLGNVEAPFAGMIRAIFEHLTGWSWDEIIEGIDGDNSV